MYFDDNCYETVKYVPYKGERRRVFKPKNRCVPILFWPYIFCGNYGAQYRNSICNRCQSLTYEYVLFKGLPPQCNECLMPYFNTNYEENSIRHTGLRIPDISYDINNDDELSLETGAWRHDRTICKLPNGEISHNCSDNENIGTGVHRNH